MKRPEELMLGNRTGLPDAIRALVEDMPRSGWERHAEFGPLTQFWLERHLGFRKLLGVLRADTQGLLNGDLDPREHAGRLARFGGMFLQGLQEHHGVEDHHYFPRLMQLDPSMERAFALLDADHHELHEALEGLARDANTVLQGGEAGALDGRLVQMERFLDRHLTDEEEVVVPVILRVGEGAV